MYIIDEMNLVTSVKDGTPVDGKVGVDDQVVVVNDQSTEMMSRIIQGNYNHIESIAWIVFEKNENNNITLFSLRKQN